LGYAVHLSAFPAHFSFRPVVAYLEIPTARVYLLAQAAYEDSKAVYRIRYGQLYNPKGELELYRGELALVHS
jgi:hypothetical protein